MSAALSLSYPEPIDLARQGAAAFVLSLRARGVFATAVLRAMETVPRDLFAPRRFADLARSDVALPLACGQTMSAPATVAAMLVALDIAPGHRVLEIGTGSGYVAALLASMGASVRSIERKQVLAEAARLRLDAAGYGHAVELVWGDGLADHLEERRYDRILLNGVSARVSSGLTSLLAANGRLVGAVAPDGAARLLTVVRDQDGQLVRTIGPVLRISPLVEPTSCDPIFVLATSGRRTEV